jgi:hypothetical protein
MTKTAPGWAPFLFFGEVDLGGGAWGTSAAEAAGGRDDWIGTAESRALTTEITAGRGALRQERKLGLLPAGSRRYRSVRVEMTARRSKRDPSLRSG